MYTAARIALYIILVPVAVLGIVALTEALQADSNASSQTPVTQYRSLAADIGFEYGREYRWREFAETKRANGLGVAGGYEFLHCDGERLSPSGSLDGCTGFYEHETMYYKNHDVTVAYKYRKEGKEIYARVLKVAEGRVPDLHSR